MTEALGNAHGHCPWGGKWMGRFALGMFEEEIAELLGIPYADITQAGLSPVAHTMGTDFKAARRKSLEGVLHVDTW